MKEILHLILRISSTLIETGGEISRVEESITRMCTAYGGKTVHAYATPSLITVTVEMTDGSLYTETCRPRAVGNNFALLDRTNDLVRRVSREAPSAEDLRDAIEALPERKNYPWWLSALAQGGIAAAFCLFFGSQEPVEWLLALVVSFALACLGRLFDRMDGNRLIRSFTLSFLAATLAYLATVVGWIARPDYIIIGYIMNLIPGLGFTGALRDLFVGDLFTGLIRILSAVLLAAAIAMGFVVTMLLFGGVV